jgi:hypothetical protein
MATKNVIISVAEKIQFLEEVVALVVDDDEGGEVLDLDPPDRFHAEFLEFDDLDLLDAVLGQPGRRAADGAEIEAAMGLAGLGAPGASGCPWPASPSSRRPPGTDRHRNPCGRPWSARRSPRHSLRRLGRAGVIDRVVLEIVGQGLAGLQPLASLAWARSRATIIEPVSDSGS